MKAIATTISYNGIPKVVELIIAGVKDDVGYCMTPDVWSRIEPCYAEKWDCILEYRYRDATESEYEQVMRVIEEMEQS